MSAILHGRLHEAQLPSILNQSNITSSESIKSSHDVKASERFLSSNTRSSTDRRRPWRQFTINYSAVCCSLKQTKTPTKHQQHTRDPRRRQTKHCRSQHKNKGRLFQLIRVLHWKIGVSDKRNCHQFKILRQKLHIRGVTSLEREYIDVPRKFSFRQAIY